MVFYKKFTITIKTTSNKYFGIEFMESTLRNVCEVMNNFKKCYSAKIEEVKDESKR